MNNRKDILDKLKPENIGFHTYRDIATPVQKIIIELLLDIRDLLNQSNDQTTNN